MLEARSAGHKEYGKLGKANYSKFKCFMGLLNLEASLDSMSTMSRLEYQLPILAIDKGRPRF